MTPKYSILLLYDQRQVFTNTVYDHLSSFSLYSYNRYFFCHQQSDTELNLNLERFDAICVHYSIRLPYDQLSCSTIELLEQFKGLKFLFIQDEYNHTNRAKYWIKRLGFHLVFTVVPSSSIGEIYKSNEFPGTRFVNNLTGYLPKRVVDNRSICPPSKREMVIGYRGRSLPYIYGTLGREKALIGQLVKQYCDVHGIKHDIAWDEESRIYGEAWPLFLESCRATLGTESGTNVFDWTGDLQSEIDSYLRSQTNTSVDNILKEFIQPRELDRVMNQISPRIFEAILAKSVLVLFEGTYSGVLEEGKHYIVLKKDGSNLSHVFDQLDNSVLVDKIADRAYDDIVGSDKYSYQSFIRMVDTELHLSFAQLNMVAMPGSAVIPKNKEGATFSFLTTSPVEYRHTAKSVVSFEETEKLIILLHKIIIIAYKKIFRIFYNLYLTMPERYKKKLRPILKFLFIRN